MPYVEYDDHISRLIVLLHEAGIVNPAVDWNTWYSPERYPKGEGLDDAPIADVVRMVTSIVRGDRFTEGTIAHFIDNGVLLTLLRRLCQWHEAAPST
jgi:hypothetical protein